MVKEPRFLSRNRSQFFWVGYGVNLHSNNRKGQASLLNPISPTDCTFYLFIWNQVVILGRQAEKKHECFSTRRYFILNDCHLEGYHIISWSRQCQMLTACQKKIPFLVLSFVNYLWIGYLLVRCRLSILGTLRPSRDQRASRSLFQAFRQTTKLGVASF